MPGRDRCVDCWSEQSEWAQASGRAKLYSFGIMHQQYHPAFADVLPYNFAVVELEEGPRMISNVVSCPVEDVKLGMKVSVVFEQQSPEIWLPKFRPTAS